jgi:hypothetical protein
MSEMWDTKADRPKDSGTNEELLESFAGDVMTMLREMSVLGVSRLYDVFAKTPFF